MNDAEFDRAETAPPKRSSLISWPAIFVVSWIIYEVTHNPGMAAMAMCLKFGWEDFRTARWLNRTDPDRGRGRACSWLYVASGLWQVAIIGVAMVILTIALEEIIQARQQGPAAVGDLLELLGGAANAILFGFIFSTVSTYVALLCAQRHGVRPWLNGAIHAARRRDCWPPLYGERNRVMVLIATTFVVTFVILIPIFLWIGHITIGQLLPRQIAAGLVFILPIFCYVILLPAAVVFVVQLNRRGFFAEHPADCWGEEPLPDAKDETNEGDTV